MKGKDDEKTWFKKEGSRKDEGNGFFTADFSEIKDGAACPYYNGLLKTLAGNQNLGFGAEYFREGCLLKGDNNFGDNKKDAASVATQLERLFDKK